MFHKCKKEMSHTMQMIDIAIFVQINLKLPYTVSASHRQYDSAVSIELESISSLGVPITNCNKAKRKPRDH